MSTLLPPLTTTSRSTAFDKAAKAHIEALEARVAALEGRQPPPGTSLLLWHDEFTGTALSYATDAGGGSWRTKGYEGGGSLANGYKDYAGSSWNVSPLENPGDSPFTVANSVLTITAKRASPAVLATATAHGAQNVEWQGGYLVSNHLAGIAGKSLTWRGGYFEFRARWPNPARGMFPALWLFNNKPDGDSTPGKQGAELDLLEVFGNASGAPWASGWHNVPVPGTSGNVGYWDGNDLTQWHRYGLEWTPTEIRYYLDGALKGTLTGPNAEWFATADLGIRLNYAIDPSWEPPQTSPLRTTTSDPPLGYVFRMEVDYVRVFAALPVPLPTGSDDPGVT